MELAYLLRDLGFGERDIRVYLALVSAGAVSARRLAKQAGMSRSAADASLEALRTQGLVSMFLRHKKAQYSAEDPERLIRAVEKKEADLSALKRRLAEAMPELRSLHAHAGSAPAVKYYEGGKGVSLVLADVLRTMADERERLYRVYSAAFIREYLYREFPTFTKERIAKGLAVKVIAIGPGGEDQPLSERRWLTAANSAPTYSIVYGGKIAFFALDDREQPIGVLIEDSRIAATERMIFDHVWRTLEALKPSAARQPAARSIAGGAPRPQQRGGSDTEKKATA